jgi:hypothetical protein
LPILEFSALYGSRPLPENPCLSLASKSRKLPSDNPTHF